jgi:MFS family permease
MSILDRERTVAGPGFNRWLIPPAALAVHLSIGQVYAFSVFKTSLVKHFDRGLTPIAVIFSIAIVMLGLSAAFGGTWMERNGPRKAMVVAAICFSAGLLIGSVGIATSQLWLLYLGYGFIGGIGLGIGYISPVSTLIKWFPDRPGLATGLAIMGFGGGALIASPVSTQLMGHFDAAYDPTVKGSTASGSAVASTFVVLGLAYLVLMLFGAAIVRVPADVVGDTGTKKATAGWGGAQVSAASAIRTPQFALLWIVLFCNVTAGIGMVYLGVGAILYLLLASVGSTSTAVFVILAAGILTFYGGGFSTAPAYLKDLFGTYQVGAIHGRLLTAWSAAGVAGPLIVNGIIEHNGTPGSLTSSAYRPALLVMVVLLVIGFACNLLIRPVESRHFVAGDDEALAPQTTSTGRV